MRSSFHENYEGRFYYRCMITVLVQCGTQFRVAYPPILLCSTDCANPLRVLLHRSSEYKQKIRVFKNYGIGTVVMRVFIQGISLDINEIINDKQIRLIFCQFSKLGFAAGTYYTTTGGGSNYQCMPFDPDYKTYYTGSGGSFAYISGVEYESGCCGLFPSSVDDGNVPCARCYTTRSAVMMIPAKTSCPSGWTEEYDGGYII